MRCAARAYALIKPAHTHSPLPSCSSFLSLEPSVLLRPPEPNRTSAFLCRRPVPSCASSASTLLLRRARACARARRPVLPRRTDDRERRGSQATVGFEGSLERTPSQATGRVDPSAGVSSAWEFVMPTAPRPRVRVRHRRATTTVSPRAVVRVHAPSRATTAASSASTRLASRGATVSCRRARPPRARRLSSGSGRAWRGARQLRSRSWRLSTAASVLEALQGLARRLRSRSWRLSTAVSVLEAPIGHGVAVLDHLRLELDDVALLEHDRDLVGGGGGRAASDVRRSGSRAHRTHRAQRSVTVRNGRIRTASPKTTARNTTVARRRVGSADRAPPSSSGESGVAERRTVGNGPSATGSAPRVAAHRHRAEVGVADAVRAVLAGSAGLDALGAHEAARALDLCRDDAVHTNLVSSPTKE